MSENQNKHNYNTLLLIEAGVHFINSLSVFKGYYNEKFSSSFYQFQAAINKNPADGNSHKELYNAFLGELAPLGDCLGKRTANKRFFNQFYRFCVRLLRLSKQGSSLVGLMQTEAQNFDLSYIKEKKDLTCFYFRKKKSERSNDKSAEEQSGDTNENLSSE